MSPIRKQKTSNEDEHDSPKETKESLDEIAGTKQGAIYAIRPVVRSVHQLRRATFHTLTWKLLKPVYERTRLFFCIFEFDRDLHRERLLSSGGMAPLDRSNTNDRIHLYLIVIGLVAGYIARACARQGSHVRGATVVLGIVVRHADSSATPSHTGSTRSIQASGIIGSVVGAVIALLVYRRTHRRGTRHLI